MEKIPNIVLPTIRSYEHFQEFLNAWKDEFNGCHVIVVEDRPKKELESLLAQYTFSYTIYDWEDINRDLGENAWIIPRKSDTVRSYGYLKAYQNDPLFILTLDDDTYPLEPGFVQEHYNRLFNPVTHKSNYYSTLKNYKFYNPRGYIPGETEVLINHGGWIENPDFDAETQIAFGSQMKLQRSDFNEGLVPRGAMFSMCGMNLSWKPEATKYLYFQLHGHILENGELKKLPIDRMGDIFAGFYAKHFIDKLAGKGMTTGAPFVIHRRASNPWVNKLKEANKWPYLEWTLKLLEDDFDPNAQYNFPNEEMKEYFTKLRKAYQIWFQLCGK